MKDISRSMKKFADDEFKISNDANPLKTFDFTTYDIFLKCDKNDQWVIRNRKRFTGKSSELSNKHSPELCSVQSLHYPIQFEAWIYYVVTTVLRKQSKRRQRGFNILLKLWLIFKWCKLYLNIMKVICSTASYRQDNL